MPLRDNVRFATRSLTKRPLFSGVIILTLGLAIGANSAIFSLIDAALLRPLNIERPEEIVDVYTTDSSGRGFGSTSYPDFAFLRDNAKRRGRRVRLQRSDDDDHRRKAGGRLRRDGVRELLRRNARQARARPRLLRG